MAVKVSSLIGALKQFRATGGVYNLAVIGVDGDGEGASESFEISTAIGQARTSGAGEVPGTSSVGADVEDSIVLAVDIGGVLGIDDRATAISILMTVPVGAGVAGRALRDAGVLHTAEGVDVIGSAVPADIDALEQV